MLACLEYKDKATHRIAALVNLIYLLSSLLGVYCLRALACLFVPSYTFICAEVFDGAVHQDELHLRHCYLCVCIYEYSVLRDVFLQSHGIFIQFGSVQLGSTWLGLA